MADKIYVRCFEYHDNQQSPYNPVPLYENDIDSDFIPSVGDVLSYAWHPKPKAWRVTERQFEINPDGKIHRCALIVEEVEHKSPF